MHQWVTRSHQGQANKENKKQENEQSDKQ